MTSGLNVKDRCRLCYIRLKGTSFSHHKLWRSQHNHRIYNIYKRRPYRYRDFIVRYLCIHLPEDENSTNTSNSIDHYSHVVCGACAGSLNKLDAAFRTFQQTQKSLRAKFLKTSQIAHYQLEKQMQDSSQKVFTENQHEKLLTDIKVQPGEEKNIMPKRHSKRKGAPKHIDQTINNRNNTKKFTGGVQLIVKIPSPNRNHNNNNNDDDNEQNETGTSILLQTKRTSRRRKVYHINEPEKTNAKKKFKYLINHQDTANDESYNFLNPSTITDIPVNSIPAPPRSTATFASHSSHSRTVNSVKGNHIERIAISLLSVNNR